MTSQDLKSFQSGSKLKWRERLNSITRYIDELESSLLEADSIIRKQSFIINNYESLFNQRENFKTTSTNFSDVASKDNQNKKKGFIDELKAKRNNGGVK